MYIELKENVENYTSVCVWYREDGNILAVAICTEEDRKMFTEMRATDIATRTQLGNVFRSYSLI